MSRSRGVLFVLFLAGIPALHGCGPSGTLRNRNVIVVLVDTLRKDRVGAFGGPPELTPHLDRLASEGFRFERAYAPSSWTKPSVASLFTGLYPARHGTGLYLEQAERGLGQGRLTLPKEAPTLAERFHEAGYVTAAFVNNPHICAANGFDRGFDTFTPAAGKAETLLRKAEEWIEENRSKPFFLYLHLIDPHSPYEPPAPFRGRFGPPDPGPGAPLTRRGFPVEVMLWQEAYREWRRRNKGKGERFRFDYENLTRLMEKAGGGFPSHIDVRKIQHQVFLDFQGYDDPRLLARSRCLQALYDGEVAYTDAALGRFFDGLRGMGLLDETVLVVTADHGEGFFEHGTWWHGQGVYGEEVDIPLLFRVPGPTGGPLRGSSSLPVSLVDLAPTLLRMLGLPPLEDADGRSLWGVLRGGGGASPRPGPVFCDGYLINGIHLAAVEGRWKMIRTAPLEGGVRYELYDLARDPGERRVLDPEAGGAEAKRVARALRRLLDDRAALRLPEGKDEPVPRGLTEEEAAEMRALGY